jgi:RNA polymerase-associated protein
MMEYLDERFPHPPLLPVYPVARAQSRLMIHRIQKDWCNLADTILKNEDPTEVETARHQLQESLTTTAPIFGEKPFFMSDEFTVVDCCVGPLLWRLPLLKLDIPERAMKFIDAYMDRLFERDAFKASLSEAEQEMRE